jgi:hypothetical protein
MWWWWTGRGLLVAVMGVGLSVGLAQVPVGAQVAPPEPDPLGPTGQPFAVTARLRGFQEVPTISTRGRGDFQAQVNRESVQFTLSYQDLEARATAAHIHFDQRHVATPGNIIAFLCGGGGKPACPPAGTVTGTVTAMDVIGPAAQGIEPGQFREVVRAIRAGVTYVNVHTERFPAGEIRGQIRRVDVPPPPDEVEAES